MSWSKKSMSWPGPLGRSAFAADILVGTPDYMTAEESYRWVRSLRDDDET